jgi:hypothetical protein
MVGGRATLIGLLRTGGWLLATGGTSATATIRTATSSQKERGFESRR